MKSCLAVLAVLGLLAVVLTASGWWYFSGSVFEEQRRVAVPHVDGTGLEVVTSNGAVEVKQGGESEVEIVAVIKAVSEERLAAAKLVAERGEGDALSVRVEWPDGVRKGREGCRFTVVTPGAAGVRLKSSNGRVTLEGLSGGADLDTSNGSITVKGHDGAVDAETSNGKVTVKGANGTLRAKSSNGSVDVSLADGSAGPVEVKTSNGSVKVEIGPAFVGTLKMRTSNGSLRTDGFEGDQVVRQEKREREIVVGGTPEPVSTVRTSNGSLTVHKRAGAVAPAPGPEPAPEPAPEPDAPALKVEAE